MRKIGQQCEAAIYKRDTYRLRRGHGFQMHYTRTRCSRIAFNLGLCRQHEKLQLAGRAVTPWR